MIEETAGKPTGDPKPVERSADKANAAALAGSSPDLAHNFIRVAEGMVHSENPFKVASGTSLLGLLLFFTIGLSSMVGAALLIDKVNAGRADSRKFQLDMFQLQTDLELKKLDKTQLGEGAMKTLMLISDKLDVQGKAVAEQGAQVGKLVTDVAALRASQQAADRRIAGVTAQQQEIQRKIDQQHR